jgi:hypothetical protein
MNDFFGFNIAEFSKCRLYRYTLFRKASEQEGLFSYPAPNPGFVQFVCLNPSTADEKTNDNTVAKCIEYSRRWGYSGMCMTNCFAWRDRDPDAMKAAEEPVGRENNNWLAEIALKASLIVCGWGEHALHLDRAKTVREILTENARAKLHYLKLNDSGEPTHPLYLSLSLKPKPFTP